MIEKFIIIKPRQKLVLFKNGLK